MTVTKNRQSRETISEMAKKAFPDKKIAQLKELTEGMCNVTYDISFEDGSESILKIAAKDRSGNTSNEVNLMQAEVRAMKLASENCSFKVADIQYYDTSNTICDGNYFFMEKLKGDNYHFVKENMSEEAIVTVDTEIGKISRELSQVKNPQFGFLGEEKRYDSLFQFVKRLLENLISDAKKRNIDIVYDEQTFMDQLEKDQSAFEAVREASLVHWDMWEGNVFVKDGHVSGIIDWERAMWGEPFMDDRFRMHNRGKHFLEGYGQTSFSEEELKRLRWYDVILFLTMMIEVYYREFEDEGQYFWAKEMLEKCWNRENGSNPDELYDLIEPFFDEGRYLDVIDAVEAFPEEKLTQNLVNLLAASYNNTKAYKKAIALIEKHKHLYENEMYKWHYYAAYAYEDLHEYKKTLDCIEAGIAECDRQKEAGILTAEDHDREVNSLLYLKKFVPEYLGGLEKRTFTKMDDKLFKILKKFYVNDNRKRSLDFLSEKDKDYLVSTGYPAKGIIEYTHDECIKAYKDLLDHPNLTMENLIAAYVCGFSSFPRGRQPILSYLFAKAVPVHELTGPYGEEDTCSICNIARLKHVCLGEKVYRQYLGYSWTEYWDWYVVGLQEFAELEPCTPTEEDIKIFNDVIGMIRNAPAKETPAKLEVRIKQGKIVPGYEKYRFRGQLMTLAELGVMPNPYIKPLYDGFTSYGEIDQISKRVPGSIRSDVILPLSGWRGDHPIDEERLKMLFGKYLYT